MTSQLKEYDYVLPGNRIAQEPSRLRDGSRLLVMSRGSESSEHTAFTRLPDFLSRGDLVVLNDSAVRPARLVGRKSATRGKVEVLLLESLGGGLWKALMKGKARGGMKLDFGVKSVAAAVSEVLENGEVMVRFTPRDGGELLMKRIGLLPLPPYIKRGDAPPALIRRDKRRYQTIFAAREGSAAAPTAGLHFSGRMFERLKKKGVKIAFVTLHVGTATFRPPREMDLSRLKLESEKVFVPAATERLVNGVKEAGGRIVAVGTTVTRTLESCVGENGRLKRGSMHADLTIQPGHRFRLVDALVTNFHLPQSSLLLLVSAFAGKERVLAAYREAVALKYRFYSFGDAMLIR